MSLDSSPEPLDIALALIFRDGRILITRRPDETHLGGLWEFPGGKCLPGEPPEAGAEREAREEVGISCRAERALPPINHPYAERTVTLIPIVCRYVSGDPQALQVTDWAWVAPADLPKYCFPAANGELVKALASAGAEE